MSDPKTKKLYSKKTIDDFLNNLPPLINKFDKEKHDLWHRKQIGYNYIRIVEELKELVYRLEYFDPSISGDLSLTKENIDRFLSIKGKVKSSKGLATAFIKEFMS